jgi:Protein of unknown function (DUF3592)
METSFNPATVITPVFCGIGALFLLIIWIMKRRRDALIAKGHNTMGTIVDIIRNRSSKGHYTYQPVIKYTPFMQPSITKKYAFSGTANQYKIGDEVEVFYDPDKPEKFLIKGDKVVKILFWVFGVMGGIFLVLGIVLWYAFLDGKPG